MNSRDRAEGLRPYLSHCLCAQGTQHSQRSVAAGREQQQQQQGEQQGQMQLLIAPLATHLCQGGRLWMRVLTS